MSRLLPYLLIRERKKRRSSKLRNSQTKMRYRGLGILAFFLVILSMVPIVLGVLYSYYTKDLPSVQLLDIYLDPTSGILLKPTTIFDRNEEKILYQLQNDGYPRRFLSIDPNNPEFFSPYLVQYTVFEYEPDFWTSSGYKPNWLDNVGPQTIAEYVVDRLLLWQEPDSNFRNVRMKILAAQITKKYGRTQVLEWFLNSQSFGHFTIGADAAARTFLGKPASLLNMAESALLVSISRTPSLNPIDAPQAAIENQLTLLQKMVDMKNISQQEYKNAVSEKIEFQKIMIDQHLLANAYTRLVLNQLYDMLGFERVELGGINVVSSLDTVIQASLMCTSQLQLRNIQGLVSDSTFCGPAKFLSSTVKSSPNQTNIITSATVIDQNSGEVLALLGDSTSTFESNLISTHQAGSILTPLIAVNAFARGFSLASQVWDIPNNRTTNQNMYPQAENSYKGPMRLRTALANDYLTPISSLLDQLGTEIIWQSGKSFGFSALSNETRTELLYEKKSANILEVAEFYATFANLGTRIGKINPQFKSIDPVLIKLVKTVDNVLIYELKKSESQSIVSPQLAYLVHDFLQDDIAKRKSLGYPNLLEIGRPAGVKYGQTYKRDEVWAVGYTPQYTTAVWFGNGENSDDAINFQVAGNVWYAMMQWLHQDLKVETWSTPAGISEIEVCALSGLLPSNSCPELAKEKFIDGTQPVNVDNLFKKYEINRETGLLATVFTPADLIESRTYMVIPDEALEWAKQNGIDLPPKNYDAIQSPSLNSNLKINTPANYEFVNGVIDVRGTVSGINLKSIRIQIGSGLNPQTWYQVGEEQNTAMVNGLLAAWDTKLYDDGLYALRLQVILEDQSIENHTIQVTIDNTAPTLRVLFPNKNESIQRATNAITTLQADIQDGGGIAKVEWWIDSKLIGISNHSPFSFPALLNTGNHSMVIKAFDLAGNSTTSEVIEFVLN
ncbi:MAG: transglycosylase domain-containing protein [Anaerolineaceae bacterium]